MGMYSFTDYCYLTIREGKKEAFLKWLDEHEDWKDITEINENEVCFEVDGWKIISYWYEDFLKELDELKEFVVGEWGLRYELPDEYAIIYFRPEGVLIDIGTMEYKTYRLEDLLEEDRKIEEAFGINQNQN